MPSAAAQIGDSTLDDPVRVALHCVTVQSQLLGHAMVLIGQSIPHLLRVTREENARDACQQVALIAWNKRSEFSESRGSVAAWLHGILINVIRNLKRDVQKQPRQSPEDFAIWDRLVACLYANDDANGLPDLAPSLAKLASEDREIIDLKFREELRHDDIAKRLGISSGNARVRLCRAINALRSLVHLDSGKENGQ